MCIRDRCKANAEIVDRYGIVQLSPTASAPDYANMSKYCFSIMGRQDVEAPYLAKYILKKYLGAQKIAVIRVDSDWGLSCYDNFMVQAEKEGDVYKRQGKRKCRALQQHPYGVRGSAAGCIYYFENEKKLLFKGGS